MEQPSHSGNGWNHNWLTITSRNFLLRLVRFIAILEINFEKAYDIRGTHDIVSPSTIKTLVFQ